MKKSLYLLAIICSIFVAACKTSTPYDYFGTTTLNTNLARNLKEMYRFQLKRPLDQLQIVNPDGKTVRTAKNYVDYLQNGELPRITQNITAIKALKRTSETEKMIDLSLDYFNAVQKEYETDMVKMAEMIDNKASDSTILQFVDEADAKNQPVLNEKRGQLYDVALPYAEKNGLKVSISKF